MNYNSFNENKRQSQNIKEQLLFYGATMENSTIILKSFIDINWTIGYKIGKVFYLSDLFEVSWKYGMKISIIFKIRDSFSILVCNTYYSTSQIEYYYQSIWSSKFVPKNGVRICKADSNA